MHPTPKTKGLSFLPVYSFPLLITGNGIVIWNSLFCANFAYYNLPHFWESFHVGCWETNTLQSPLTFVFHRFHPLLHCPLLNYISTFSSSVPQESSRFSFCNLCLFLQLFWLTTCLPNYLFFSFLLHPCLLCWSFQFLFLQCPT